MLLLRFANVIFSCCEHYRDISIHLHYIGVQAETSETHNMAKK